MVAHFKKLVFEKYVEGGTCDATAAAGCVFPPDRSKDCHVVENSLCGLK
jgi:hypothetical protein